MLREKWASLPFPRPENVEAWAVMASKEIEELKRREAKAIWKTLKTRLSSHEQVFHVMYGVGRPVCLITKGDQEKLVVNFSSCGEKRFNVPQSFYNGGLQFTSDKNEK